MRRRGEEEGSPQSNAEFPTAGQNQGKQLLPTGGITFPTLMNTEICNRKRIFKWKGNLCTMQVGLADEEVPEYKKNRCRKKICAAQANNPR
jgi:hypothetical protein